MAAAVYKRGRGAHFDKKRRLSQPAAQALLLHDCTGRADREESKGKRRSRRRARQQCLLLPVLCYQSTSPHLVPSRAGWPSSPPVFVYVCACVRVEVKRCRRDMHMDSCQKMVREALRWNQTGNVSRHRVKGEVIFCCGTGGREEEVKAHLFCW